MTPETLTYILPQDFVMNKDLADQIRALRCDSDDYSWRRIATFCADKGFLPENLNGNQLAGIEVCELAAKLFGENAHEDPWN